jgi:dimethylhistidine N-methyltransferase
MPAGYRLLDAETLADVRDPQRDFALDVLVGFSEYPKQLPSKHFYDAAGSAYFQQIMALDEYYLTACEREILERHRGAILSLAERGPINLVDLGAGDGAKTLLLLEHLRATGADFRYVPIDISEAAMQRLVADVERTLPGVEVRGLVSDYVTGLSWLGAQDTERRNLVLFLGSNIGNFDRPRARAFLRRLWIALRSGDCALVGFDLKKDIELLLRAYNDSRGITAMFNLNLLHRINRELGADFDPARFRHFGTYDVLSGAMKSYLVSLARQTVTIGALQQTFTFEPWEPIFTEYSYKYLDSDIEELAGATGFVIEAQFHDRRRYFVDSLWRVERPADLPVRGASPDA